MEILTLAIYVVGLTFNVFRAYMTFHVVRWLLLNVNAWRSEVGKNAWSDRFVFLLALFSALALVI